MLNVLYSNQWKIKNDYAKLNGFSYVAKYEISIETYTTRDGLIKTKLILRSETCVAERWKLFWTCHEGLTYCMWSVNWGPLWWTEISGIFYMENAFSIAWINQINKSLNVQSSYSALWRYSFYQHFIEMKEIICIFLMENPYSHKMHLI